MKITVWTCIRNKAGKYLLLHRSKAANNSGQWCMPGGQVDLNEPLLDAARRECKEEIGIDPGIMIQRAISGNNSTKQFHYFSPLKTIKYKIKLNNEADKYGYFNLNQIKKLELHEPTKYYFNQLNPLKFTSRLVMSNLFETISGLLNNKVVVSADICLPTLRLVNLYTDPAYRGQGYSKQLLDHIMTKENAPILITAKADLDSPISTDDLVKLYSRWGFQPEYSLNSSAVKMRRNR